MKYILEHQTYGIADFNVIYYHGTTQKGFFGTNGIHVGTKLAAKQALEARIGVPAEGEWDGTRKYGETLLAGKTTLRRIGGHRETGYNCGVDVPSDDYYPTERATRATYSDLVVIDFELMPIVFPVRIIGKMTNTPRTPHTDARANAMMKRAVTTGKAVSGFYYINDGEDSGSISAVVPNGSFLEIVNH